MHLSAGRPTLAQIDGGALCRNLAALRACLRPQVQLLAVVKADAYGHGAGPVAKLFERAGADAFGVATVEEGAELRAAGIRRPILVLPGARAAQVDEAVAHELSVAVVDRAMLGDLRAALRGRSLAIHVKVDTGMGRLGVTPEELPPLLEELRHAREIRIQGLFSHFANADLGNTEFVSYQLRLFREAIEMARRAGIQPPSVHIANSAATVAVPESHFSLVRPGIALYGIAPTAECPIALEPAMRVVTRIVQIKTVPAERPLSYGQTFVTRRPSRIATIPIGYADGYDRRLSNRAEVLVKGRRAPVVGRVCMDLTLIDVTDVPGVTADDEVVLWGRQENATIGVEEVGAWQDSIAYEVLTRLGKRVPRVLENEAAGRC